MKDTMITEV